MSLLDLPNELLDPIIHEVVRSMGAKDAWKLRSVCKTFARQIREDVLGQQYRKALRPWDKEIRPVIKQHKSFILARRCIKLLDACPTLTSWVRSMSKWLFDGLQEDDVTDTKHYIGFVSDIVTSPLGTVQFILYLYHSGRPCRFASVARPLSTADKLAVAVCLPEHLAKKLIYPSGSPTSLLQDAHFSPDDSEPVFGHILYNAVTTHLTDVRNGTVLPGSSWALDMLDTYLHDARQNPSSNYTNLTQHLRSSPFKPPKAQPIRSKASPFLPLTYNVIEHAISLAMGRIDNTPACPPLLQRLFTLFDAHYPPQNKASYNAWLECAIRTGNGDVVRVTLARPCPFPVRVTLSQFSLACGVNAEVVRELLRGPGLSPDEYYRATSPLMLALRRGTADVVRAVVEEGADVNARRKRVAPLRVALASGNVMKVKVLLDRDVRVKTIVSNREMAIINRYKQVMTAVGTVEEGKGEHVLFRFMSGRIEMRRGVLRRDGMFDDREWREGGEFNEREWHRADSLEDLAVEQLRDLFRY